VNTDRAHTAIREALAAVAPEADLDDVRPKERLRDALDLDSLDFLSLIEQLRHLTGVDIPESDYAQVNTVDQLSCYLVDHGA